MNDNKTVNNFFYSQIVDLLQSTRSKVVHSINHTMLLTYFEIGKMIVQEEQGEKERAGYGKEIPEELSKVLSLEFGKGFSLTNLKQMKTLYLVYSKGQTVPDQSNNSITQTLSRTSESQNGILSWSHYLKLMHITDKDERSFYKIEFFKNLKLTQ